MSNPQAGWYHDPEGRKDTLRYWDGEKWAEQYMQNPNAQPASSTSDTSATPAGQPVTTVQTTVTYSTTPIVYERSSTDQMLLLIAFIMNCISLASVCWLIIPLAWMIPMLVRSWGIYKGTKPNTITFGVCTLIFFSLVSGILMLCAEKDD